jgi:LuxR family maltose regulon positive regulatory protein
MNRLDDDGRTPPSTWARSLASSKITMPPAPERVVARPRLDTALSSAHRSVTLVTANAGWGKSVAVRDWVTRVRRPVAWLTLDRSDNEANRFLHQVLDAIRAAVPSAGSEAARLLRESGALSDRFAAALADDVARLDGGLTLVLDDVHLVDDPLVHARLTYLVEHAPSRLHLVVIARERPPLPIARWRARATVTEVSEPELAFRVEEAAALLATFDGLRLAPEDVEALTAQTEGWAMGLHLAALTLRRSATGDRAQATRVGIARGARFLVHEVVAREPRDVRDFLYATSVVDVLNPSLCRALTGRDDAPAMLRTIEDRRLFLVALDNRRECFRYHRLFRDALVDELVARDELRVRRLHARAAEWFAQEGDVRVTVEHLLAAGETERAFDVAVDSTPAAGAGPRDGDWLDLVPPELVAADGEHMARFAVAFIQRSSFADADRWLTRAEVACRDDTELGRTLDRTLVAMRSQLFALRGDAERAIDVAAPLLPFDFDLTSEGIVFERLPVNLARSHVVLGDADAARAYLEPLAARSDVSDEATLVVAPAALAVVAVVQGRLRDAFTLATAALQHAGLHEPNFGELDALLARTTVLIERGELDAAESDLTQLRARSHELDSVLHGTIAELTFARLALCHGDGATAAAHVDRARERALQSGGAALPRRVDAFEARACIRLGAMSRADALVPRLPHGDERALLEIRLELLSDPPAAAARLAGLHPSTLRDRIVRELLMARAASSEALAERHRHAATVLAEPEGFVQVFAEEGAAATVQGPIVSSREALSDRELVVLQHLGTQASNATIAGELFISSNTLKTHLQSIYRKLGAASRGEAVENARKLGIL